MRAMSASVASLGVAQPSPNGMADAATVGQLSSPSFSERPLSQGRIAEPLRPEWASWMPNFARPALRADASTRASAASLASE